MSHLGQYLKLLSKQTPRMFPMFIQSAHFSLRNEKIFVSVGKKKDKSPFRRQYDAEMVYTQIPRYRRQVWHLSVDQRTAVTETSDRIDFCPRQKCQN